MPTVSLYFDLATLEAVNRYAEEHGRSVSWAVRTLVRNGLKVVRAPVAQNTQEEYQGKGQRAE